MITGPGIVFFLPPTIVSKEVYYPSACYIITQVGVHMSRHDALIFNWFDSGLVGLLVNKRGGKLLK